MIRNILDERTNRIGQMASAIFLAGLFAMFAYGYLTPIVTG